MKIPGSRLLSGIFLSLPEDSVLNERPWMKMSFGTGKQQFPHRGNYSFSPGNNSLVGEEKEPELNNQ